MVSARSAQLHHKHMPNGINTSNASPTPCHAIPHAIKSIPLLIKSLTPPKSIPCIMKPIIFPLLSLRTIGSASGDRARYAEREETGRDDENDAEDEDDARFMAGPVASLCEVVSDCFASFTSFEESECRHFDLVGVSCIRARASCGSV